MAEEIVRLSPSSLGLLSECPRCFWLRFRARQERPRGIFPSLPGAMDRVIKAYADRYRGSLPPELEGEVAEGGRVIFQVQPQQVETSLEDAYGLLRDASKVLRGEIPDPAPECEYCRWQAMGAGPRAAP